MSRFRAVAAVCLAAGGLLAPLSGAGAQSLLDRPPNLHGGWVGNHGQVYFNFLHRFVDSGEPEHKVTNFPNFTLAAGLPYRTLLGASYSTNSTLAPRYPNEWEFFLRHAFFQQDGGVSPVDVVAEVAYNLAADGVDGELSVGRRMGGLRLVGAARVLADPFEAGATRFALAGGGTLKVSRYVALAGDVGTLLDREEEERVAWGAGVHLAIPGTPHTFSLQASNVENTSLQSASRGQERIRYGFEFTVPITLARWFGGMGGAGQPAPPPAAPPAAQPAAPQQPAGPVARAGMRNLAFIPARIEITAGTTVEWTNNDPLDHTVTAADRSFDSGLIKPGQTWRHTFTTPGTYNFVCTPHPFMKGVVVVR